MASFSKAMIIGNLGRDPEMRYTPNGRPVTEFSVAVNQSTKNQQTGEWVEATDWFRVTVWGDRAERTAESLRKGNRVFVEGRFRTREYEARDGQKRISLEITADNVVSLEARARDEEGSFSAPSGGFGGGEGGGGSQGGGGGGGGGQGGDAVRPTRPAPADDDLDDLPF
jgi:single-strand DNA-binding protein